MIPDSLPSFCTIFRWMGAHGVGWVGPARWLLGEKPEIWLIFALAKKPKIPGFPLFTPSCRACPGGRR